MTLCKSLPCTPAAVLSAWFSLLFLSSKHLPSKVLKLILTSPSSTTIGLDGHSTIPHPEYSTAQRVGYQLADVSAGMGYTFFMTLGILYLMKLVAFMFGKSSWSQTGVYSDSNRLEDNFQAVVQQQWRGDLDPEGRPFGRLVAPSLPPAPSRPLRDDDIHLEHLKNLPSPPRSATSGAQVPPWGMMPELPGSQGMPPWPSLPSQELQPRT